MGKFLNSMRELFFCALDLLFSPLNNLKFLGIVCRKSCFPLKSGRSLGALLKKE